MKDSKKQKTGAPLRDVPVTLHVVMPTTSTGMAPVSLDLFDRLEFDPIEADCVGSLLHLFVGADDFERQGVLALA